jgi:transcriptional regulator with XRE-family HTH domain
MDWNERLKHILDERGSATRGQLREFLGIEESTLRSYLNGNRKPDIIRLAEIADFLNISLDVLMGRTQYVKPPLPGGAVNEDEAEYRRLTVLRQNFDGLTRAQQDEFLRDLQATKQKNEALVSELTARKKA